MSNRLKMLMNLTIISMVVFSKVTYAQFTSETLRTYSAKLEQKTSAPKSIASIFHVKDETFALLRNGQIFNLRFDSQDKTTEWVPTAVDLKINDTGMKLGDEFILQDSTALDLKDGKVCIATNRALYFFDLSITLEGTYGQSNSFVKLGHAEFGKGTFSNISKTEDSAHVLVTKANGSIYLINNKGIVVSKTSLAQRW